MQRQVVLILGLIFVAGRLPSSTLQVPSQYSTIQAGIDAASDGDTVIVAAGTFWGTGNVNLDFTGKEILVISEEGAENTIIDCLQRARGFLFYSGENENSILQGFTIRNGYIGGEDYGGGIICYNSSPAIRNNIISECYAYLGGGIGFIGGSAVLENNEIARNEAERGGGIGCYGGSTALIADNYIHDNYSSGG